MQSGPGSNGNPLHLDRRRFLRGLGTCVALPLLESLRPAGLFASTAAVATPLATTAT